MEFALAAIVVGLVIALYVSERRRFDRELAGERHRGDDLLDRLMARSHEQYVALGQPEPELTVQADPPGSWVHDPTGLFGAFVPDEATA